MSMLRQAFKSRSKGRQSVKDMRAILGEQNRQSVNNLNSTIHEKLKFDF